TGISGSNLKKRIEDIMRNRVTVKLSLSKALLLIVASIGMLAGPIVSGVTRVKTGGAQSDPIRSAAIPIGVVEERSLSREIKQRETPPTSPTKIAAAQGVRGWTTQPGATNSWPTSDAIAQYHIGEIKVIGGRALPNDVIRSLMGMIPGDGFNETRLRKA